MQDAFCLRADGWVHFPWCFPFFFFACILDVVFFPCVQRAASIGFVLAAMMLFLIGQGRGKKKAGCCASWRKHSRT